MAYAPLFHEIHSGIFLSLCKIINKIHRGQKMTRQDILHELSAFDWNDRERTNQLIDAVFLFPSDGYAVLFLDKPISILPSSAELVWLRRMLEDQRFSFLLPPALREKLQKRLEDVPLWPENIWQVIQEQGDTESAMRETLSVIWRALHQKKKISYQQRGPHREILSGICSPFRLEYDASANCYDLIIWREEKQSAGKIRLSELLDVQILDERIPDSSEKEFQDFLQRSRRKVCIQVARKNNAVERCFMMFASYDKEASYDEDQDIYTLTIFYYDFDREDILQQIISLGAAATILSPEDMRQAIIQRLTAAWKNIQD